MPTTTINLTGQALSKVDDTNVTLTLGGTPLTALLKATSLTLGWTGTLADARIASAATWNAKESALTFSTGLTRTVNTITIDNTVVTLTGAQALSNKTGNVSQWTNDSGYLTSLAGAVTSVTGSGNIASSGGATPNITFTGVLPTANGGTAVNIATQILTTGAGITNESGAAVSRIRLSANNNIGKILSWATTGLARWAIRVDGNETGANAGGDIALRRYDDAGTFIDNVWSAVRSTGAFTFEKPFYGTSSLTLGTASTTAGKLTLQNATNAFTQTIRGTNPAASITYDLPTTAPTAGQVLSATAPAAGIATLSWATASSGITVGTTTITSGTTGRIPYNNAGVYSEQYGIGFIGNSVLFTPGRTSSINDYSSYNNTFIGVGAGGIGNNYPTDNVAVGYNAMNGITAAQRTVAIGKSALASGDISYSVAVGNSTVSTFSNVILLGYQATATAQNQMIIGATGSDAPLRGVISNVYYNGVTYTSASSVTINACGGSGTNNAGASFTIAGGKGTGTGAGGNIIFQTSTVGASGTTLQTLATRVTVSNLRAQFEMPIKLMGYTVATLPAAPSVGDTCYVTDATLPTYNAALVGSGAVTVRVFYNGAAWVSC